MNLYRIGYWALFLFCVYLIFELIRNILGGSLGFQELTIGLLLANLGYTISLHRGLSDVRARLSHHLGWHRGQERKEKWMQR